VPRNSQKIITRKGVNLNSVQTDKVIITTVIDVPAGADNYDPESVRAALSLHAGALWAESSDVGDQVITNVL
jgi:hypothetical protein